MDLKQPFSLAAAEVQPVRTTSTSKFSDLRGGRYSYNEDPVNGTKYEYHPGLPRSTLSPWHVCIGPENP